MIFTQQNYTTLCKDKQKGNQGSCCQKYDKIKRVVSPSVKEGFGTEWIS